MKRSAVLVVALLAARRADAYCNSATPDGTGKKWGPRTSTDFKPGWNGLAATPFRGWRSWYAYYTKMDQAMITDVITALTEKNRTVKGWAGKVSLADLGYSAAGIDEGWEGCGLGVNGTQHYLNGTPATNPQLFPDMKGLVDFGHSKGLKMGWYFNGCGCAEKRMPASGWDVVYEGDIRALADMGWDGVKFDGCGRMCNMTLYAELMNKTGKSFAIENCHWGDCSPTDASSCPTRDWCPFNWYRVSGDSNNGLGTWYANLQGTIKFQDWEAPVSQPGCWAYPDMLQVGRLGCPEATHGCPVPPGLLNWTRAHFSAFAIVSSPLVLSIVPTDETLAPLLDIIGNKQAMAVNQAWAGHPGTLVATFPPTTPPCPACTEPGTAVVGVPCDAADKTQTGWAYDAAAGHITHGGLCLSAKEWGIPLNLYSCGNASTHQHFTYDATGKQFQTKTPANGKGMYPADLEVAAGPGIQKAYVYRPGNTASMQWVAGGGSIKNPSGQCLAARGEYMPAAKGIAGIQIWAKPLGGGKTAALFINGGSAEYSASISLKALNLTTAAGSRDVDMAAVTVTDVWGEGLAGSVMGGNWTVTNVPSMDSRFVILASG